jgi:hypothetical protein
LDSLIDREGAIASSHFSLFEQLPLTLVLFLVLQRFGPRQWGEISELIAKEHLVSLHPVNADGTLDEDQAGVNFYPKDRVHSGWSLLGRATTVVGANTGGSVTVCKQRGDTSELNTRLGMTLLGSTQMEIPRKSR